MATGDGGARRYPGVGRVVVVLPTYNEAGNVGGLTERVRRAAPAVDVLIADDNSPDGTGQIADRLAARDRQVHVLHRPGKQGLGAAYVAGFTWARQRGYDAVVEMDADGSHRPEELPGLLDAARRADVVIGSRWAPGGRAVGLPWRRRVLSRAGNLYARLALGMPVRDATGGYRVYRMPALEEMGFASALSQGFAFQVELSRRARQAGCRMAEVPITFAERENGTSKMSLPIIVEALLRVTLWAVRDRRTALRWALGRPARKLARWP
ncbi:MAG TPA: polyprenol monophosphomannose synthase [Micromonosporaceae bacterium]